MSSSIAPQRLAVYGSLAPGQPNHHHLADIPGTWRRGWVEGSLCDAGWGATLGFPGIRLRQGGPRVDVLLLESAALAEHWDRLDALEGKEYRRVEVEIHRLNEGPIMSFIYELR